METVDKFETIWISVTYNCNNRCKWCYASSNLPEYRKRELEQSKENPILNLLVNLGIKNIRLIGGEPTIYPNIIELTRNITNRGLRASIVTNGRRFSDKGFTRDIKEAGLAYASFSVEGYNTKVHEEGTCVRGSFDETMQGLENAIKLGIGTATNTTITKENIDSLEKIIDLLKGKPDLVTFNICGPCLRTESNAENAITPREGAEAFERIYLYSKPQGIKVRLVTPTPVCNIDADVLKEMKKDRALSGRCQMLSGRNFVIDYNGDILPCTHFSGFSLFNVFQDKGIMSREEFIGVYNDNEGMGRKLRDKVRHFPSQKCTDSCQEFCTGGCPLFWTKFDPDEQIKGNHK